MNKQEVYEQVKNHWKFNKDEYPLLKILNQARDRDVLVWFAITHNLRHLHKCEHYWIQNEYNMASIHKLKDLENIIKITLNLLKIAVMCERHVNTLGECNVVHVDEIGFDKLIFETTENLEKICDKYEHGKDLDYDKIHETLDHFFYHLESIFCNRGKEIPWNHIPKIMKNK